jgi:hypothetical protein
MASRRVLQQPKAQLKHQAMLVLAREQERNRLSRLQVPSVAAEMRQDASRKASLCEKDDQTSFSAVSMRITDVHFLARSSFRNLPAS